jgi:integrase
MGRYQHGYVYGKSGSWHVRFYEDTTVDGKRRRVQKSRKLIEKDRTHHSSSCKAVQNKSAEFMATINTGLRTDRNMRIADFWESRYLPFIEKYHKPSTVSGYRQIWKQHLEAHFADLTLQDYQAHIGFHFLMSLPDSQGRRTVFHVKHVASGLFNYAIAEGRLQINPWLNIRLPKKAVELAKTPHYTLEESETIISALIDHLDCQLVMALACFMGLRPGEIAGLRWEDFDDDAVHIRRAVVRGKVGTPKTPESIATLPLVAQVRIPLQLWRMKCGNPSDGWLFARKTGTPVELRDLVARKIKPILEAKNIEWKSLYAGRRGVGTAIIGLTNGNYAAAQELLRHKNMTTTLRFYKKKTQQALTDGMRALEAALTHD